MDERTNSVLVIDSGIGGMTIVQSIKKQVPSTRITYLSDNAYFPYGRIAADTLSARVHDLVGQALEADKFDAVVIACNTASTIVLDSLRAAFSLPIVGVVPPIKTAGEVSQSRVIALLATAGTIRRPYIDDLIATYANDCKIRRIGNPELARLAEAKAYGQKVDHIALRAALAPLRHADFATMDTIVLGCTHYPIIQAELAAVLAGDFIWLDPAPAVAEHLNNILSDATKTEYSPAEQTNPDAAFFTADISQHEKLLPFLEAAGFASFNRWPTAL